ncbi:MAG: 1-phosphofructokinase family hexose kinase [Anaerolineaceae bacterium]|nr:1-phosphofructokinase family hexose kinase [Anaerolineaceae bacterium]
MILAVCPNTAIDKIIFIKEWIPGTPMRTNHMVTCVGGKGLNSAVVLRFLGAETVGMGFFAGKIGEELVELLGEYGIIPEPVWVGGTNRIAHVIAEEKTNIHSHVIAGEVVVSTEQKQEFVDKFKKRVKDAEWVIFAGSLPPSLNVDFYSELIAIAKEANVPSLIDSQKQYIVEAIKAKPEIVKMNWEEFEWTFNKKAETLEALIQQTKELYAEKNIKNLVITLGKNGILVLTSEGNYLAKAPFQKPVNAAGAGDAVSSTLAYRLSKGDSWESALRWASAVSAATVLTERTGDVDMKDVERIYKKVEVKKIE